MIKFLDQDRDFSDLSQHSRVLWTITDGLCTGVLEVLIILGWFGVYDWAAELLPGPPQVEEEKHINLTAVAVITRSVS